MRRNAEKFYFNKTELEKQKKIIYSCISSDSLVCSKKKKQISTKIIDSLHIYLLPQEVEVNFDNCRILFFPLIIYRDMFLYGFKVF